MNPTDKSIVVDPEDVSARSIPKVLAGLLEVWAHQLLYQRRVYPRKVFGPGRFLGVRVQNCRHPQVVSYIQKAVKVAVPALTNGVADQIIWSRMREDVVLEAFRLEINDIPKVLSIADYRDWERKIMRSVVLSVISLPTNEIVKKEDNSISFRIQLHICSEQSCSELNEAFASGNWRESPSTNNSTTNLITAPLLHMNSKSTTVRFFRERQEEQKMDD